MDQQEFIKVIKEKSPTSWQRWADQRGWYLPSECNYSLQVWIYDDIVKVSPQGYGSVQSLIAVTPDELAECIDIWWRNR